MEARFGPAGNAVAFSERYQSSLDAPAWIAGLGLDCYEYQCGKGVRIGQDTAEKLGERARQAEIALSLHAPYFINLANPDPDRKRKLLLHKRQIRLLREQVKEKGMALVPLKMYFKENSLVKVELGVARGKKLHDKRATMAERDSRREIERALKERSR